MMEVRGAAAQVLQRVLIHGQSLSEAQDPEARRRLGAADGALLQELCYGVCRWYGRLDAIAGRLLDRPMKRKDGDVQMLLLLGLYQLIETRIPPHAAVAATAEAARGLGKPWAVGLINAVLRRFQREQAALLPQVDRDAAVASAHPAWLVRRLRQGWPQHWQDILAANNLRPPLTLRVNRRLAEPADYLQRLAATGIAASPVPWASDAVVLEQPVPVETLPGFSDGLASVQDAAAQLAADFLDVPTGARVLDACAAPGGKACHLLERYPGLGELVALDLSPERLTRVGQNLKRLNLRAELIQGDAAAPDGWWDGQAFERILLDAPCSGTGVIRRHPDIKWLRREADLAALAETQGRLLRGLWPLLVPGGKLVYATCSVMPEENERVLERFLAEHADARAVPPRAEGSPGLALTVGLQLLPGGASDGFYYGCLIKQ